MPRSKNLKRLAKRGKFSFLELEENNQIAPLEREEDNQITSMGREENDQVTPHVVSKKNRVFAYVMGLLVVASLIYFRFIASDIYVTESKFVVRSSEKNNVSPLGGMLEQIGVSESHGDSWIVHDYMLSKDALNRLNDILDIKKQYSDQSIDRFSRFPGLRFWDKSMEAFYYYYYQSYIGVSVDPASSITTLTVKSFQPETALRINEALLEFSEELINKLNERARTDLIKLAQSEVSEATQKIYALSAQITNLRKNNHISDPEEQGLQLQQLSLEKELANKELAMSLSALQKAKTETIKQQLYITRVSNPSMPDAPLEPYRIRGVLSTILLGFLVCSVLSLLLAGIKEHYL